jgi:hypothetical protein
MSNLSDIGFPTPDETAINEMIIHVLEVARPVPNARGFYLIYSDPSGAEIFLQGNFDQELVGFNPHFAGDSNIQMTLIDEIERDSSEFDGGFRARAGDIEFVFDVPDFRMVPGDGAPRTARVQLTAFASNDLAVGTAGEGSLAAVPPPDETVPARPVVVLAGELTASEKRRNELSGEDFYVFRLAVPIGEIDVVCDPKWIRSEPRPGDFVSGTFWMSGRVNSEQ